MASTELAAYLYAWNDWIVFPVLAFVTLWLHLRRRKTSTLVLLLGFVLMSIGKLMVVAFGDNPSHPLFLVGPATGVLGIVLAVAGFVWFVRKDNVAKSVQT